MTFHDEDYRGSAADAAAVADHDAARSGLIAWGARAFGALVSVGLAAGLGLWAWQLTVRDVGEVPVVRALDTPMRVAPDDPGGESVEHQGLAVNSVPAEGTVEAPPDELVLAPAPIGLAADDLPVVPAVIAAVPETPQTAETVAEVPIELETERPLSILEALQVAEAEAGGATPAEALVLALSAEEETDPVPLMPVVELPPPSAEGAPVMSFPPRPRPAILPGGPGAPEALLLPASFAAEPAPVVEPVSGAQLAQLGAYDTVAEAQQGWAGLVVENADLLGDRAPMILPAQTGGRNFYRLRVGGFGDLDDARRFCAALGARGADCVPVTAR